MSRGHKCGHPLVSPWLFSRAPHITVWPLCGLALGFLETQPGRKAAGRWAPHSPAWPHIGPVGSRTVHMVGSAFGIACN